ncbi:MAG TPA: sigma-54 dependent transcriptional regulator, partial [Planctomycetota bacterium]|nr:sigma-54 dependent transcriptional regulator [Planctomycetota bacterium]
MRRILIIDGDRHCRTELQQLLQPRGFQVVAADTGESALQQLRAGEFELVLAELQLPDLDGFELLQAVQRLHPDLDVILMAAFGSVEDAVQAMRNGAADFISKPFAAEQVLVAIDRVLEKTTLVRENHDLRVALDDRVRLQNLIGTDGRMQAICKTVRAVADTRTTVLLTGESGTGKTLLARAIHALSSRHNGPFVEVNCGALPESLLESELFGHVKGAFTGAIKDRPGKFEAAQGGTIFLDEVGTSSPAFQIKLLRVVQDRLIERVGDGTAIPVDIRILLATNLDLEQAVSSGAFRADLYYRINVVAIEMPALRSRPNDIPLLAEHFLRRFAGEHRKSIRGFTQA